MTTKTNSKHTKFQGKVIYKAYNPLTKKLEQVFPEDEMAPDTMVMPLYWVASDEIYVTIPGTEVYGYVPSDK